MEYRILGQSGLKTSVVGLGTMVFGWKVDYSEAFKIFKLALESGINFVDTSSSYAQGRSEQIVGRAINEMRCRSRVILATKFNLKAFSKRTTSKGVKNSIVKQCEESLTRLKTDVLDLFQLHRPNPLIPTMDILPAVETLIRSGKVRFWGTSTLAAWQMVDLLWLSKTQGFRQFVSDQTAYNLLDRRIETEVIPMAETKGLGLIVWSPLAEGLLTGKYAFGRAFPKNSRLDRMDPARRDSRRYSKGVHKVIKSFSTCCRKYEFNLQEASFSWVLSRPGITSVLAGPSNCAQMNSYLLAARKRLPKSLKIEMETIVPWAKSISPYFEPVSIS